MSYKAIMVGVAALIVAAVGMGIYGYGNTIYPVDASLGYLARAESAQTPDELAKFVTLAKAGLPVKGNPVWSFPTARTDFGYIQNELDNIVSRANSIYNVEPHSSAYNTGMEDMHVTLEYLQNDIMEALPYMYVSTTNMMLSVVWIAIIMGLFAVMRRGRAKYRDEYESQQ
ncbi:MAG TPA: hypothetical protein VHA09_07220 [Nitrososphaera sp.]|nr:hypothetical protein [Nitrososphaera sp.]